MESVVWIFTLILALQCGGALGGNNVTDMENGMAYMHRYGYVGMVRADNDITMMDSDQTRQAILMFQRFANLNMTGEMDEATMEMMSRPRCGVPDMNGTNSLARRRRYALLGSRWTIQDITYRITGYTQKLPQDDVDNDIKAAFDLWSENSNLKFTKVDPSDNAAHITMFFAAGDHGDQDPFDGSAGVLAHALPPIARGETHFDDDETWTVRTFSGINLLQVAAHEFGHALGLGHSDVEEALMAPFYAGYKENLQLHADDIRGIQILYGMPQIDRPVLPAAVPQVTTLPRPPPVTPTVRAATKPPATGSATQRPTTPTAAPASDAGQGPGNCDGRVDAITQSAGGKTYAFRGEYFWELTTTGVAPGYPKKISGTWTGLPGYLNGALYRREDGKTYFFKGSLYWRFSGLVADAGYPKPIREGFTGVPDNIDAAFQWSGNGKIYFTKGNKYYRYDWETGMNSALYPQSLARWTGLPSDRVDAAFQWINGKTYFFKGPKCWLFNDFMMQVDAFYPQYTSTAWFGCKGGQTGRADWTKGQPIIVLLFLIIFQMSVMLLA
ncbi:MMP16 [Branchiostoma lanceolatum]|uniref:MMP16 protein n=1 Tax=Branchiostoma lanceolatum TaxID=7740 RepID=A0A8J9W825_BRALA|nr:MMP16 [Branchiostoma lanceolatum]